MRTSRTPEQETARYCWITTSEAARRIGGSEPVSTEHVSNLIRERAFRARNVARPGAKRPEWRVDPESLDAWLESRENRSAA